MSTPLGTAPVLAPSTCHQPATAGGIFQTAAEQFAAIFKLPQSSLKIFPRALPRKERHPIAVEYSNCQAAH